MWDQSFVGDLRQKCGEAGFPCVPVVALYLQAGLHCGDHACQQSRAQWMTKAAHVV